MPRGKSKTGERRRGANTSNELRACVITLRLAANKSFDEIDAITGICKSTASAIVRRAQDAAGGDASFSEVLYHAHYRYPKRPPKAERIARKEEKLQAASVEQQGAIQASQKVAEINHHLVGQPLAKLPIAKLPITKQPITKQPITKQPIVKQPIVNQPIARQPLPSGR